MDINQIIIAGEASWYKLQMAKGQSFGSVSIKLNLPRFRFTLNETEHNVQNPFIWLSVNVSQDTTGKFKKSDERLLDALNSGTENYLIATAAKISNWTKKGKDGGPDTLQFKCECPSGSVSASAKLPGILNEGTFKGKVTSIEPSGKMSVECSYMSPKANEWKTRQVPCIYTGDYDPSFLNKKVLFFGSVCNVTPTGDTKLYIVTNHMYIV